MSQEIKKALEAEGEEDFPMLLFPVIPVGLSTEHKNFCGSVTVRPDTYYHLLYDICVSLAHHGFKKLAFLVLPWWECADCAGFKPGTSE